MRRELHQELYDALETQLRIADWQSRASLQRVLHAVAQLSRWRRLLHDHARDATDAARARLQPVRSAPQPDGRRNAGLPWSIQVSGILKLISGSPIKVQAGPDLDGDTRRYGRSADRHSHHGRPGAV